MNSFYHSLIIYNGYPLSVTIAVSFHSLLLAFLIWLQSNANEQSLELVQPTIIKALFIDENPQVRNQRVMEQQRIARLQQEEQNRILQERETEREMERERQRQEDEQQRAALRERAELERLQREKELERQQQEREESEKRELAEREELERQQEAERNRALEENAAAAQAEAARTEFELVQSATAIIQQAVQQVWNRPPSARNGMRAILQIQMLPTGELLDVRITQTSGDAAFDRASENAVYSAAPFTELRDLPINIFNANFRTLSLIFQPEDLLN
ncbi:MAG: TonB family protein [Pseudohongiellaceae bacterium]